MIFRIATLGIGALAMYYFDPVSGTRRRAQLREKLEHYQKEARNYAEGTIRQARSRTKQSDPAFEQQAGQWPVDEELRR